jgi:hypothetical protein
VYWERQGTDRRTCAEIEMKRSAGLKREDWMIFRALLDLEVGWLTFIINLDP